MSTLYIPLEPHLLLRQYTVADARNIFELIDRNRVHLSQNGDETAQKYRTVNDVLESIEHPKNPSRLRMGIWHNDRFTGAVNLTPVPDEGLAEIGYFLGEEFEGQGLATKSVCALAEYGSLVLGVETIFARVHPENRKSARVLARAQFVPTESSDSASLYYTYKRVA